MYIYLEILFNLVLNTLFINITSGGNLLLDAINQVFEFLGVSISLILKHLFHQVILLLVSDHFNHS